MSTFTPGGFGVQSPSSAVINAIGGQLLATGGGYIAGPPVVVTAGSADCVATIYDGTSTSGKALAVFSLRATGAVPMANWSFSNGLFVNVTGTTAATWRIDFTG